MPQSFDSSRWSQSIATITTTSGEQLRLNYIDCETSLSTKPEVILLIHGFPQTSYQFRHVITPLADAGYRVIAPDYRGADTNGRGLTHLLTSYLKIEQKIHIVGHDIGGMIAWAYAAQYPDDVASLIWGECPLPGTEFYEEIKGTADVFHFVFHQIQDLPEALIAGRERLYLQHFFDKMCVESAYMTPEDLEHYVLAYSQPGGIRAGLEIYRAFEKDAEENRELMKSNGKINVKSVGMFGEGSFLVTKARNMLEEVTAGDVKIVTVGGAGHYIAEEKPGAFVDEVLKNVQSTKA